MKIKTLIFYRPDHVFLLASEAGLTMLQVTNSDGPEWEIVDVDYDPTMDMWRVGTLNITTIDTSIVKRLLEMADRHSFPGG